MGKLGDMFGKGKKKKAPIKKLSAEKPLIDEQPAIDEDLLELPDPDGFEDINLDEDPLKELDIDDIEPLEQPLEPDLSIDEDIELEPTVDIEEPADEPDIFAEAMEENNIELEPTVDIEEPADEPDIFAEAAEENDIEMDTDEDLQITAEDDAPGIAAIDDTESAADFDEFISDIDITEEPPAIAAVESTPEPEPQIQAKPDKKAKKIKEPKAKKVKPPKPVKVKPPKGQKQKQVRLPSKIANPEVIGKSDHQVLFSRVAKLPKKQRCILFGGSGIETLPVTIPVNIAMELAKNGKKCLLIDLDLKRNAIASAFDIEEETMPKDFLPRSYDTSLEKLKVWPAHNFTKRRYVSLSDLKQLATKKYDYVLINAPYLDGHYDRSLIAMAATSALIFTQNEKQTARLYNLLTSSNCKIVANIQVK